MREYGSIREGKHYMEVCMTWSICLVLEEKFWRGFLEITAVFAALVFDRRFNFSFKLVSEVRIPLKISC